MTEPSEFAAAALLLKAPPGRSPSSTRPVAWVQRKASIPAFAGAPYPTTTSPADETPVALLLKIPPEKSPSPTIPDVVHRNASEPLPETLDPTTTEPAEFT